MRVMKHNSEALAMTHQQQRVFSACTPGCSSLAMTPLSVTAAPKPSEALLALPAEHTHSPPSPSNPGHPHSSRGPCDNAPSSHTCSPHNSRMIPFHHESLPDPLQGLCPPPCCCSHKPVPPTQALGSCLCPLDVLGSF